MPERAFQIDQIIAAEIHPGIVKAHQAPLRQIAANAGIDSRVLLRRVLELVKAAGWQLGNLDVTVIAQAPKMAPHIDAMCDNLAADLDAERAAVNVKATTTEGLGFAGRAEGIAVHAVVLLTALSP